MPSPSKLHYLKSRFSSCEDLHYSWIRLIRSSSRHTRPYCISLTLAENLMSGTRYFGAPARNLVGLVAKDIDKLILDLENLVSPAYPPYV